MGNDSCLKYIINYVFLPPKLSQKDDSNVAKSAILTEKFSVEKILEACWMEVQPDKDLE